MQRCGIGIFKKGKVQTHGSPGRNKVNALRKQKYSHMTKAEELRGREVEEASEEGRVRIVYSNVLGTH